MAEEKNATKAKTPDAPSGKKRMVLLGAGALGLFLVTIPLHLYLQGMLQSSPPYLRPSAAYVNVDSLLALERAAIAESAAEETGAEEGAVQEAVGGSGEGEPAVVDSLSAGAEGSDVSGLDAGADPGMAEEGASADTSLGAGGEAGSDLVLGAAPDSNGVKPADPLLPCDAAQLTRLVSVYEKMKPRHVALIINTMSEKQGVTILSYMKAKAAAAVLAEMDPGKAARMSQLLLRWSDDENPTD
jgi:hypothetical protein